MAFGFLRRAADRIPINRIREKAGGLREWVAGDLQERREKKAGEAEKQEPGQKKDEQEPARPLSEAEAREKILKDIGVLTRDIHGTLEKLEVMMGVEEPRPKPKPEPEKKEGKAEAKPEEKEEKEKGKGEEAEEEGKAEAGSEEGAEEKKAAPEK